MRGLTLTVLLCIVIILVVAAIICHIIALATDYWLRSSSAYDTNFLNIGLFVGCFDKYTHVHDTPQKVYDGCHRLESDYYATIQDWLVPSWLVSCRILAIIALIMEIVGVIVVILLLLWWFCKWICCDNINKRDGCERCMIYAAPILFILAGMFLMCTVMIFGDNAFRLQCRDFWVGGNPNTNHLSWSWGFEIAATILAFLSGGFLIWLVVLKARDDI